MNSITLFIDGEEKTVPFPTTWNELTQIELRYCISAQGADDSRPKIFCFLITTAAAREKLHLPAGWQSRLDFDQAARAAIDCLEFLYDANTLTKSPFKKIKVSGVLLHGPADDFDDLTCRQMELAHPALERFRTTNQLVHLQELCSYLFRRGKAEVSEAGAKALLPFIKKMPLDVLLCMYTWFAGCLTVLPTYFEHLYDTAETKESAGFDFMAFTKLIHSGAGERNGSREDIRRMDIKQFLFDLDLLAEQAAKMEAPQNDN
jgi:hypothetical protein